MRNLLPSIWGNEARDPFGSFRREMDDFMRDFGRRLPTFWENGIPGMAMPSIDVAETRDTVEVTAELPGVDEKDVRLSIEGNRLILEGEKRAESTREDKDRTITERTYGSFRRSVPLSFEPGETEVTARFDKGVLHVSVPKPASMKASRREIPISAQGTATGSFGPEADAAAQAERKNVG